MAERKVRLGIVGVGSMGQAHVRGLDAIPEAQLVAVCDRIEEQARTIAEPRGAEVYTDGAAMMAQANLDALYICVPPHTHEDLELRAAERGLHLFVEKPVNLTIEQARKAGEALRAAGVMTQVGYQMRYMPQCRQLKAFLADKQVGMAQVTRWGGAPGKDWWRRYDQSGGQLVEMTTHQVDLLRWTLGEVESVSAHYSFDRLFRGEAGLTVPDSQSVLLRFVSGASATISTSCAIGKSGLSGLDFVLRDARVSVPDAGVKVEPEGFYSLPPLPSETLTADEAFVRAVAAGDRSLLLCPYEDGMRTLAVTLAANRSAEEGGRLVRMEELLGPMGSQK